MLQKPTRHDYYLRHYSRATAAFQSGFVADGRPNPYPEGTEDHQDFIDGVAAAQRDAKDYTV